VTVYTVTTEQECNDNSNNNTTASKEDWSVHNAVDNMTAVDDMMLNQDDQSLNMPDIQLVHTDLILV